MSVKSALLKALGFSSGDDDDYDDMADLPSALPVNQQQMSRETVREIPAHDADTSESVEVVIDSFEFPLSVFDGLLQVFNDAQPDFIKNCINTDAQRRYLYESMDASFKESLSRYSVKAREAADRQNAGILRKVDSESAELRKQLDIAKKSLAEAKEKNMSAVRQRRAFNERIHDLEQQLENEKAEKDQYALETKSLLNKLKVAQVSGASDEESAKEILSLRSSIEELQVKLDAAIAENDRLSRVLAEKQAELEKAQAEAVAVKRATETVQPTVVSFAEAPVLPTKDDTTSQAESHEPSAKQVRKPKKQRRQKQPTASISVIDDTLDTTEWLVPTPPAGSARSISSVSDSEFGYHEPQRDEPPVNDAQLSLFD